MCARAGRHLPGTPASKRLRSGRRSRVLLYLTGHGGDEFLKFHDQVQRAAVVALRFQTDAFMDTE